MFKITGMNPRVPSTRKVFTLRLWRDCSTNKFFSLRSKNLSLTNKKNSRFASK